MESGRCDNELGWCGEEVEHPGKVMFLVLQNQTTNNQGNSKKPKRVLFRENILSHNIWEFRNFAKPRQPIEVGQIRQKRLW